MPQHSKLTQQGFELALRMAGEGLSSVQIRKELIKLNESCPSQQALWVRINSPKNQPAIQKYRELYMQKIMDVPISNKRVRLDIIQKLITQLTKTIQTYVGRDNTINESKKYLMASKRLNDLLQRAQEEMEKKPMMQIIQPIIGGTDEELLRYEREVDEKLAELRGRGISLPSPAETEASEGEASEDKE